MTALARTRPWLLLGFITVALAATTSMPTAATGAENPQPVTNWVRRHAVRLDTVDAAAPLDDLRVLRHSIGDAGVVGLGETMHGTAEHLTLRHRAVRFLVEEMGFRSIAWEEQWTTGVKIDEYIRTGIGDLDALAREMSSQWRWDEVKDVLVWLRQYNASHTEQVRFVGVDYYLTWRPAYDAVETYVARVAPDRLAELRDQWAWIRPEPAPDYGPEEHVGWYMNLEDRSPYIGAARAMYTLVDTIQHEHGDAAHDLALHNARQILSFYEHYDLPEADQPVYRDARAAENLDWWHRRNKEHRIAYWAANAHTANAPQLRITTASGEIRFPSTGSYLRQWYGNDYVSVGFTFDRGVVAGEQGPVELKPAKDEWLERPLRDIDHDQFLIDLRRHAPRPVRRWLDKPAVTRAPDPGPDSYMDGGSLRQWFDVLVHRHEVTPAQQL